MTQNNQKCSVIALIGSPNAGKSTLLNQLIGSKISIVSPKVQTTRDVINGICIHDNAQLIFCDTPGIFSDPKRKIEKTMVKIAWDVLREVDHIALIIDSRKGICANSKMILNYLSVRNTKPIIILNKIDLLRKNRLLELIQELNQLGITENIFMLSALNGDGVLGFKEYLAANAKEHPWLYPEDDLTTAPKRFIAAEIVREKLFLQLEEELPYNILVDVENWEEFDNGQVKIDMLIYCTKDSHKSIILGKAGKMIKMIGLQAREELEQLLGQKIHLYLFVKVKDDCIDNFEKYR